MMASALVVFASVMALAEPPAAAPPAILEDPVYLKAPKVEDLARFYPPEAQLLGLEGRAEIECVVAAAGALSACRTTRETPANFGFGDAAIGLTPNVRVSPVSQSGAPTAGRRLPMTFRFALADGTDPADVAETCGLASLSVRSGGPVSRREADAVAAKLFQRFPGSFPSLEKTRERVRHHADRVRSGVSPGAFGSIVAACAKLPPELILD